MAYIDGDMLLADDIEYHRITSAVPIIVWSSFSRISCSCSANSFSRNV